MRKKLSLTRTAVAVLSVGGFTAWDSSNSLNLSDAMLENLEALSQQEASSSMCCEPSNSGVCWYQNKNSIGEIISYGKAEHHSAKFGC